MSTTSSCRSCSASIRWARTASGAPMPLDAEPVPGGNVTLSPDGLTATVHQQAPHGDETTYLPHFATCPDAGRWRKR